MTAPLRISAIALVALMLSAPAGCVTQRTTHPRAGSQPRPAPASVSRSDPAALPSGPIATPALTARTVNARTLVGIRPIGTVPYDGMVLPIVSPDGMRLATQTGDPPTWPTLLAAIGAPPAPRTRIELYDITVSPPKAVRPREILPGGLLLGRGADAQGFLVESPQADGTRRIARISWRDASLQWLTEADAVNAFPALDDHGRLLCSRRTTGEVQFRLAIAGVSLDLTPGASALMPTYDAPSGLYALFAESEHGLEIQLRTTSARAGQPAPVDGESLHLIARRTLGDEAGAPTAYQAAEPMRAAGVNLSAYGVAPGVLIFHPAARRMVIVDPNTADLIPLAPNSIAGCWAPDAAGWAVMLTTPDGLIHQRLKRSESTGLWEALPVARMLGDAWVARATTDQDNPFILIGPTKDRDHRLSIAALRFADDSEEHLDASDR